MLNINYLSLTDLTASSACHSVTGQILVEYLQPQA